jgi:two-component system sensor histidine kinase BaeS
MPLPRLRIAHQLSMLLTITVVTAVVAVGTLSLWNLRSGFTDYLRLRDEEQLTRFVQLVERHAAADGGMAWLTANRGVQRDLMDEFNGRQPRPRREPAFRPPGMPPPFGAGPGGDRPFDPPPRGQRPPPPPRAEDEPPDAQAEPPPPRPPDPQQPGNFAQRVVIRDLQRQVLAGRPPPAGVRVSLRAVKLQGADIAWVELAAEPEPEGMDALFLKRQYKGLIAAGLATVLLTVLLGTWAARRWSRPLRELQQATRRIAQGERSVQIPSDAHGAVVKSGALEIDELIADVNAMAVSLGALEEARRTWIAQISHELRTPLAVLRGELEAIEDGARQPTPEVIRSLGDEVAQLTRLVDDLHTLTMADLGRMPCEFAPADAEAALQALGRKFGPRAAQLGLALYVQPPGPPIAVDWDMGRIEQLLSNLLENSLRYTSAPGRIQLRWTVQGQLLQLRVDDSAPAVQPAQLGRLFDPLFRADVARTRTGQHGSGLGLSIVQAIARAHRGHATAELSPLGGLSLCVDLPLYPQRLDGRRHSA